MSDSYRLNGVTYEEESEPVEMTCPSVDFADMQDLDIDVDEEASSFKLSGAIDIEEYVKKAKRPEIRLPYSAPEEKMTVDEKILTILRFLRDAELYFGKLVKTLFVYKKNKGDFHPLDTPGLSTLIIKKAAKLSKEEKISNCDEITMIALKSNVIAQVYDYLLMKPGCAKELGTVPTGYVNFRNCVVDVRTLKTVEHDPKFGFTYAVNCDFRADAKMGPVAKKYFGSLGHDIRDSRSLLQVLALSLIGSEKFDRSAFIIGPPANGKSTLAKLIEGLLPEDACQNLDFFQLGDKFAKIKLARAQVSICHDLADMKASADAIATFKNLVTHDTIVGRDLYKSYEKIRPRCFMVFIGNSLPIINDNSGAIQRRQWLIRTGSTVPEEDRDPYLLEKLQEDIVGIVATAIRVVHKDRLLDNPASVFSNPPEVFSAAVTTFNLSVILKGWCASHLKPSRNQSEVLPVSAIRKAFCETIPVEYLPQVSENGFARALRNSLPQSAYFMKKTGVSCLCGYEMR